MKNINNIKLLKVGQWKNIMTQLLKKYFYKLVGNMWEP